MKIAYLILVHENPRLLKRLITTLSTEESAFFVHVDGKADIRKFAEIADRNVRFTRRRIPVRWGEFSQVEASNSLLSEAINHPEQYDYFVFLQGSDYPLRSGEYIHRFFAEKRGREFINLVSMPAPGFPLSKINKIRYPRERPIHYFTSAALAKLGFAQRDYRKYLGELQAYAGSACWALSRSACQYVLDFANNNPQIEAYFRNVFTSDEMFLHTILGNSPYRNQTCRNLHFTDWSAGVKHPAILSEAHISSFEKQKKIWIQDEWGAGEILFARKFSDARLDLIDRVDAMIKRSEEDDQRTQPARA